MATPHDLIAAVSAQTGVPISAIMGRSRLKSIARARKIAIHVCRRECHLGLSELGQLFRRDRATIRRLLESVPPDTDRYGPQENPKPPAAPPEPWPETRTHGFRGTGAELLAAVEARKVMVSA